MKIQYTTKSIIWMRPTEGMPPKWSGIYSHFIINVCDVSVDWILLTEEPSPFRLLWRSISAEQSLLCLVRPCNVRGYDSKVWRISAGAECKGKDCIREGTERKHYTNYGSTYYPDFWRSYYWWEDVISLQSALRLGEQPKQLRKKLNEG